MISATCKIGFDMILNKIISPWVLCIVKLYDILLPQNIFYDCHILTMTLLSVYKDLSIYLILVYIPESENVYISN